MIWVITFLFISIIYAIAGVLNPTMCGSGNCPTSLSFWLIFIILPIFSAFLRLIWIKNQEEAKRIATGRLTDVTGVKIK